MPMAEEAVVSHAMKSRREHVKEHPPDELRGRERHRFLSLAVPVIGVPKPDLPGIGIQQSVVGNSDAVRVATDVVHHLRRAAEGRVA
jgi:hypothetical protein